MSENFLYHKGTSCFLKKITSKKTKSQIENWSLKIGLTIAFFFCLYGQASAATLVRPPNNLGLVGYWAFDEGTGLVASDMSGNGNKGTRVGTSWVTGKRGKALSFNGTTDYVNLGILGNFGSSRGDGLSVSAWVKIDTHSQFFTVVGSDSVSGTGQNSLSLRINAAANNSISGGSVRLGIASDEVSPKYVTGATNSSSVPVGVWTHVVATVVPSTNTIVIYVNGVSRSVTYGTQTTPLTFSNFLYPFLIGAYNSEGTPTQFADGNIDDVRVYSRVLTASQVAALYQSGQTTRKQVSNQGLVGYWSLNEGRGLISNDSSGNRNAGTLSGFALSGATSNWTPSGKKGGALSFDGTDDYMNLGSSSRAILSGVTSYSVSAWVKTSTTTRVVLLSSYNGFSVPDPGIFIELNRGASNPDSGKIFIGTRDTADNRLEGYTTGATNLNNGSWHHIVVTVNITASTMALFLDGVSLPVGYSVQNSLGTFDHLLQDIYVGALNNIGTATNFFSGSLDDLRIYNRALSAAEVAALYRQNETRINSSQNSELTSGLVGLWSFNGADYDNSSTTAEVLDRSGQGNNGNAVGGPVPTIGKVGQGLRFDGVNDYVAISSFTSDTLFTNTTFTVSIWFKSTANNIHLISKGGNFDSPFGGWHISLNSSGNVQPLTKTNSSNNSALRASTGTYNDGRWHQATVVFTTNTSSVAGNSMLIYVDGVLDQGALTQSDMYQTNNTDAITIGTRRSGPSFSGNLDEVRIYNRALSAAEVKMLYNLGK